MHIRTVLEALRKQQLFCKTNQVSFWQLEGFVPWTSADRSFDLSRSQEVAVRRGVADSRICHSGQKFSWLCKLLPEVH